jgi:hypothetical protein
MRGINLRGLAVTALLLASSSYPVAAGGWGCGGGGLLGDGWGGHGGYGGGCGVSYASCGCGGAVSYAPVTTYVPRTVYTPQTVYTASTSYVPTVSYEQSYVVDQGPSYAPAVATYRPASYTYDEPREYGYVGGYGYRGYRHGGYGPRYGRDRWGQRWQHRDHWRHHGFHRHATVGGWQQQHVGRRYGYGPRPVHHMHGGRHGHRPMLPLK